VNGHLVTPGDITGFADALALYCTNLAARQRAGAAGLAASQRFGWDEVNQTLVDSYIRVISRRQKRA
jgi:glycosyltransferase involved in cell wall biosynthesis